MKLVAIFMLASTYMMNPPTISSNYNDTIVSLKDTFDYYQTDSLEVCPITAMCPNEYLYWYTDKITLNTGDTIRFCEKGLFLKTNYCKLIKLNESPEYLKQYPIHIQMADTLETGCFPDYYEE